MRQKCYLLSNYSANLKSSCLSEATLKNFNLNDEIRLVLNVKEWTTALTGTNFFSNTRVGILILATLL